MACNKCRDDKYFLVTEDALAEYGAHDGDNATGILELLGGYEDSDFSSLFLGGNMRIIKGRFIEVVAATKWKLRE